MEKQSSQSTYPLMKTAPFTFITPTVLFMFLWLGYIKFAKKNLLFFNYKTICFSRMFHLAKMISFFQEKKRNVEHIFHNFRKICLSAIFYIWNFSIQHSASPNHSKIYSILPNLFTILLKCPVFPILISPNIDGIWL